MRERERNLLHWHLQSVFVHAHHEWFLYFLHFLVPFSVKNEVWGDTKTVNFFFWVTRLLKTLLLFKREEFSEYGFWYLQFFLYTKLYFGVIFYWHHSQHIRELLCEEHQLLCSLPKSVCGLVEWMPSFGWDFLMPGLSHKR